MTGSKLDWESSLVWFPCPEGCGGLIRVRVRGVVEVVDGERVMTTATADRADLDLHMEKNHGKAA